MPEVENLAVLVIQRQQRIPRQLAVQHEPGPATQQVLALFSCYRLVGLVVKASALRAEDLGFYSHLSQGNSSGTSHTSDLKIGTLVADLPSAWHCRVTAGTGWPSVSIL